MKKADALWEGKIRPGFEMLVDNFSAGILGMLLAIFGFFGVGLIVSSFTRAAGNAVDFLVRNDLLPLTSLLIEPAKVLFLNNAINHGVLTPLGTTQALDTGKSILFLLETNPGPGLGVLLARSGCSVAARPRARHSAPRSSSSSVASTRSTSVRADEAPLIAATILGGMTGVFVNVLFGSGLRAPAAPGSIIAIYAQTAGGSFLGVTLSVLGATAVSFAVASLLLKTDRAGDEPDLASGDRRDGGTQGQEVQLASALVGAPRGPVSSIVFACDAGRGSSAMGASVLRKKIRSAGFGDIAVTNQSIANLTDTYDLVVTPPRP